MTWLDFVFLQCRGHLRPSGHQLINLVVVVSAPALWRPRWFCSFHFHKGALYEASCQWSGTRPIMWLPPVSQTFPWPRLASSPQPRSYPAITSAELFLLLSYDVLWRCSGSRTGTLLSLCHLIDTLLRVTCACAETRKRVTGSTSPRPCAAAYVQRLHSPV